MSIRHKLTCGYLLMSYISGFLELGAVIYAIRSAQPLYLVAVMGLAYQLGALVKGPFKLGAWQYCAILAASLVIAFFSQSSPSLLFLAVMLLSVGIQGVREILSKLGKVSTPVKRLSRVAGFACSGLFSPQCLPAMAGLSLLVTVLLGEQAEQVCRTNREWGFRPTPLGWLMTIHQSHYFSYAYVIPVLLVCGHGVDSKVAGFLFCIGWFSYILAQKVFGERALVFTFAAGHVLASLCLLGLFLWYDQSLLVVLALWFLTGFGGGTVYCLRRLSEKSTTDKSDLDQWENLGHILGVILSIFVLVLSTPRQAFLVASLIAATTCLLFLAERRTSRRETSQRI